MAAQPTEAVYEVIVWDYDGSPGAAEYFAIQGGYTEEQWEDSILPYYCCARRQFADLQQAKRYAWQEVESDCGPLATGAAVFVNGTSVWGIGLTFAYKEKYL